MPKISSTANKSLFIKFALKSILSTAVLMLSLCALSSVIFLKLDLDLKYQEYFAYIICGVVSFITSYISLSDFKNNYLLVSIISVVPLILFSLINGIVNRTSFLLILSKLGIEIILAMLSAVTRILRKRR